MLPLLLLAMVWGVVVGLGIGLTIVAVLLFRSALDMFRTREPVLCVVGYVLGATSAGAGLGLLTLTITALFNGV